MNNKRYIGVTLLTLVLFLGLGARLFYVTVIAKDEIFSKAQNQIVREIIIPAKRGDILDRNGSLLASTTEAYRIDADLTTFRRLIESKGKTPESYAAPLAEILGEETESILEKLTSEHKGIIIKRKIEKDVIDRLRAYISEEGISFLLIGYDNIRYYPNNSFLSHVLGSVNVDGTGVMGLEYWYDETLRGVSGIKIAEVDKQNRELPYSAVIQTPAINGSDLTLTIDEKIQYFIENLAEEAMEKHEADSVTMIVSDPRTGGVLGMVNLPDFDPNNPREDRTQEEFDAVTRNFAVNDSYEPGSTFKIVTISSALEEGLVDEHDHFNCPGYIMVNGVRVNCVNRSGHGDQSLQDVLKNSCNVGTILIAQRLGEEKFNAYVDEYLFGQKTGIDLPGETTGIVFDKDDMKPIDLATSSIGQAQTVSPVQMMNAINTISNGGVMKPLHLAEQAVLEDVNGNLTVRALDTAEENEVIRADTAERMLNLLYGVVGGNDRSAAYIEDIPVYGKTGTAQKIITDENGNQRYSDDEFISSFIGGAPYTDPKITVLVIVNNPKDAIYGNTVAAPWAKEIFLEVEKYLPLN
ncbi:stage V sporulation protein D [Proteiniclasticum sp. SCR006]|uniref:Stage V sporulation protein D n=1 Tax=Proteiniclasticum aestuarii TaxID=2817862 RepID=A0A939H611_9CLOT|nr:penicillin-binding transpeptidase domain-containing protein [Proteiniclasticum aestuarii]MBO1263766.1 stage V sporulation protein D [Proteiniclasticum aestuarii]